MTAQRRTRWNPALDHALDWARRLRKPLLIFEPLRVGYSWASVRHHQFVIEGMVDNAARCAAAGVTYLPYVEPSEGAGSGLLEALAAEAALVVADDAPMFFLPRMLAAARKKLTVRMDAVDGCGLLPLSEHEKPYFAAWAFRWRLQRQLPTYLQTRPAADPLAAYDLGAATLPATVPARWPVVPVADWLHGGLARLPLDSAVRAVPQRGGPVAAEAALQRFLVGGLPRYATERSDPDAEAASGLSPYLHFGHLSAYEVAAAVLDGEGWTPSRLAAKPNGKREGWWGASTPAEAFLDELVTWRELGWGAQHTDPTFGTWEGLPEWARGTLLDHARDPRPYVYDLEALTEARTHDPLWNAAQRELVATGRIQNHMRMLWGKKVLEWTPDPRTAFDLLIELNQRWSVDGRDPNSFSGISWTFGRFDRPWAPERPIFGTVRTMSSDQSRKKLDLKRWLARWGPPGADRPAMPGLPFPERA